MHLGNPKTAKIFQDNFFQDFKEILGKKHVIKKFDKCDFEPIRSHLNEQKLIKKAITDEERKANKEDRNQVMFKFGFAIVDGHLEKVGNFNMVRKPIGHDAKITSVRLWWWLLLPIFSFLRRTNSLITDACPAGTTWNLSWTW